MAAQVRVRELLEAVESEESGDLQDLSALSNVLQLHSADLAKLREMPRSYLYIPVGSLITLPPLPWSFRGYSIAMWIQIPPPPPVESDTKRIRLFKFYSTSKKQGTECWLSPLNNDVSRVSMSIASAANEKGWRHVSCQFGWNTQAWHLVVVTHKQHYLKRSHVECFVNAQRVMKEDLPFPTQLGLMSQCFIGGVDPGGNSTPFQLSGMTMYEDELRQEMMEALYHSGPSHTCLPRLFYGVNPFQNTLIDTKTLSKATSFYKSSTCAMNSNLKVVFSFSAQDVDDQNALCTQWQCEGDRDKKGRWIRLKAESDHATSQQTHVVLNPGIMSLSVPDCANAWFRHGGILSIAVVVHAALTKNPPPEEAALMLGYALQLMHGLLCHSIAHQEEMLHGFGFYLLSHVLRSHPLDNEQVLSSSNATACVELVVATFLNKSQEPPPLFSTGIQALLFDFDLWGSASFKTQSILIQQLVQMLESIDCLHSILSTQRIADVLRRHYSKSSLTKRKAKDITWVEECVRSLVLMLELGLLQYAKSEPTLRIFVWFQDAPSAELAIDSILIPIELMRSIRIVTRFLLVCPDALLSKSILHCLCRLAETDNRMRLSLLAANIFDCALYLLQSKHALSTRLGAMRLFITMYEWMDSNDGHTVMASIERHFQLEQVDGVTAEYLQEMMHDPLTMTGLRNTIAMNAICSSKTEAPVVSLSDSVPSTPAVGDKVPSWVKPTSSSRLVLSYDDRLVVMRAIALRYLEQVSHTSSNAPQIFTEWTDQILELPLRGTLPFIACLFSNVPPSSIPMVCRERVLMEISVVIKTDPAVQKQILALQWVEWLTTLLRSCCQGSEPHETGEDLIFDTMVTLLCSAMYNADGWKCMQKLLSLLPTETSSEQDNQTNPFRSSNVLVWCRRLTGLVLVRLVRGKTILSRALAENVHNLLILVYHLTVGIQDSETHLVLLISSVLDVAEMLLESTHKMHRAGLVPALRICRVVMSNPSLTSSLPRLIRVLEIALQQQVSQRMPLDESVATHEMLLRVLGSLELGMAGQDPIELQLLGELSLKIATSGEFGMELKESKVSIEMLGEMPLATAVRLVISILLPNSTHEALHPSEMADLTLKRQKLFPMLTSTNKAEDEDKIVLAASNVEESRMLEVLKEIAKKEQERMLTEDARVKLRQQWTDECWKFVDSKVRSQAFKQRKVEYELTRHETPQRRRLRLDVYLKPTSLMLEAKSTASISRDDLLKKVGRVIAQQPKEPIEEVLDEEVGERPSVAEEMPSIENDSDEEELEEDTSESLTEDTKVPAEAIKLPTVEAAKNMHPSVGVGLLPDDRIYLQPACRKVVPEGLVSGTFYVCDHAAVFQPQNQHVLPGNDAEWAVGLHRSHRWKLKDVVAVYLRRYRLRESAIEIFMRNGTTHFLDFHGEGNNSVITTSIRNDTVRTLLALLPSSAIKQWPGFPLSRMVGKLTREWQARAMSNYDYLMALNTLAGRSFNDLTQYPVFPWVLSNYTSPTLDLSNPENFRDLSKPMGALNAARLEEYWERYHSFDDPIIPKFLYGSHYSTAAGVVLYFLVRLQPFASLHQVMQGGSFDLPDRLFNSIADVWDMCNSSMSEVKELTPEWYSSPAFLINTNQYNLGARQDGKPIGDVELPPWASDVETFIKLHRTALESEYVSAHLHEWIDLIFGYKQRGDEALAANNVFYYLTYYGLVDLDAIDDPMLRTAMEQQIAHFGQCPRQLFTKGHPARGPLIVSQAVARPLSISFLNHPKCPPPSITRSLGGYTALRAIQILSDRLVAVNELGVIELHHWKLQAKQSTPSAKRTEELSLVEKDAEDWCLVTERDLTPFDVVPRLPMYSSSIFPISISSNGRVVLSGGAPTGTIHVRLIDLANGHVVAKASVDGHSNIVTCLHMTSIGADELVVSGSKDCSVLLWQLSQMNTPFRLPRISASPLMIYRGHEEPLVACFVDAALGVVASTSTTQCLVHNLHTGHVLFQVSTPEHTQFEQVVASSKGYIVTRSMRSSGTGSVLTSYNMLGTCVGVHELEPCLSIAISSDGGLLIAYLEFAVRFYRLDDFLIVHEYRNPDEMRAPISCGVLGPTEACMLAVTGHADGSLVWHQLPDADGRVSLLGSVVLNINSRLKVVKGTVQQAQSLAMTTMDNARAVTNTAKDIAGEAKTLMQNIFGLLKSG